MTSIVELGLKYSKFSAALMIDSGWYGVDLSKTDYFYWGQNEGCGFIN